LKTIFLLFKKLYKKEQKRGHSLQDYFKNLGNFILPGDRKDKQLTRENRTVCNQQLMESFFDFFDLRCKYFLKSVTLEAFLSLICIPDFTFNPF